MFTSVLVANRGEIAVRICKTLRRMGIRSVVVASIPDRRSLAVRSADDWVLLEGYSAAESYLDVDAVIAAAKEKGCEAIHPGYGFLSERADFADRCAAEGIVFIGSPPSVLRGMGDKSAARRLAVENGVPVVPGWDGTDDDATLIAKAAEIGFPVMVKARGGGGGRGMRPVHDPADLPEAIESARREAESAFGDPGLLLEKLVTNAHHVEVQVVADSHGNVIHLGERDCSVQRRRQKLIEETPSPIVDDALRAELTGAALKLARAVGYVNAGTFEFLVGPSAPPSSEPRLPRSGRVPPPETPAATANPRPYYFLEVNPRLQVEHPVTEMVTGLDLVELQLRIAAGESLPVTQEEVTFSGHAIEFRINAEDPWNDFRPSSGEIRVNWTPGFNVHSAVDHAGGLGTRDWIPPQYDSLVAKQVASGPTRAEAIQDAREALDDWSIDGIPTNIELQVAILNHPVFVQGDATVDWLERALDELLKHGPGDPGSWIVAAVAASTIPADRWVFAGSAPFEGAEWKGPGTRLLWLRHSGRTKEFQVAWSSPTEGLVTSEEGAISFLRKDGRVLLGDNAQPLMASVSSIWPGVIALWTPTRGYRDNGLRFYLSLPPPLPRRAHAAAEGATAVTAPLAGTIASVRVAEGDAVDTGDLLLTLDAMKMEHRITATSPGTVASLPVAPGDVVREGDTLVELA